MRESYVTIVSDLEPQDKLVTDDCGATVINTPGSKTTVSFK